MADRLYLRTTGTTCYLDGARGTVTGLHYETGKLIGAFVQMAESGKMVYCFLDRSTMSTDVSYCDVHRVREIDRDTFDQITGLDQDRVDLGWRAP